MNSADAARSMPAAAPEAVLGMYPYPFLRNAWQVLYLAAAADIEGAPAALDWTREPHDTWLDPRLAVGMTCGWPLVTALSDRVRVVGTFAYDFGGQPSHRYRSVIVAGDDVPLVELTTGGAAVNSLDSLSGHISLLDAFDVGSSWPGRLSLTGAHLASIDAVRAGAADVASIDELTWAFHDRDAPGVLEGLVVVGRGPLVPCLPIIVGGDATDAELAAWRAGFASAVRSADVAPACRTLMISDFVPLDAADYTEALAPLLARHPPPAPVTPWRFCEAGGCGGDPPTGGVRRGRWR